MSHSVDTEVGDLVTFTVSYTSPAWAHPKTSRSTLRFLDATSLATFLGRAGLTVEAQFGDWDRRPPGATAPEIITVARRREP
jgi:hypothetical protein